jgi:hypothetical protein
MILEKENPLNLTCFQEWTIMLWMLIFFYAGQIPKYKNKTNKIKISKGFIANHPKFWSLLTRNLEEKDASLPRINTSQC